MVLRGISHPFGWLSPARGEIAYVLLTRTPLYSSRRTFAFDLHVLGPPLTFALSQDQTLQLKTVSVHPELFEPRGGQRTRRSSSMSSLLDSCH